MADYKTLPFYLQEQHHAMQRRKSPISDQVWFRRLSKAANHSDWTRGYKNLMFWTEMDYDGSVTASGIKHPTRHAVELWMTKERLTRQEKDHMLHLYDMLHWTLTPNPFTVSTFTRKPKFFKQPKDC